MTTRRPAITLHVITSLDGFIAKHDGDMAWLGTPEHVYERGVELSDADVAEVLGGIDAYVLGPRTYDHALELGWPYGDTPVIVVTGSERTSEHASVEFQSGADLARLMDEVLAPRFNDVWLAGGAALSQSFLAHDLVDRLILTIAPVTLGSGLRLFGDGDEQSWRLTDVITFKTGYVEMTYDVVRA